MSVEQRLSNHFHDRITELQSVNVVMGIFEDHQERHISVQSGQPAIIDMAPIESVPPPAVSWQSVDGPLNYDIKYAETTTNQLIILSADEDDQHAYRARAINTQLGKEENSAFVQLNVTGNPYTEVAPEIVVHPVNLVLVRGRQLAEMQCIANARPLHELETLWLKDGIPIETAGVAYTLSDPWNRTLALLTANQTHTGEYGCHVRLRSGGFPTVTATATVRVQEPPAFYAPLRGETLGEYGTQVVLPCDVTGEPAPLVTWFRNAEVVPTSAGERYAMREDNALLLRRLTMEDAGMFQCLASNEAGERSTYTWLKVKSELIYYFSVFWLSISSVY